MKLGPDGRLRPCRFVASANHDERPADETLTLLVLHSISLPPGEYGGDAIERLFTNRLEPSAHPYFREIAGLRVSSHFLIRRDGELVQFVPTGLRAWHAGESRWRGRARCNDFSIGVELEGSDDGPFEPAQYRTLARLIVALRAVHPLHQLAAHSDVAPGRKTDPGPGFDWRRLFGALAAR
ncbi:MAG: 1,6-anhydro-N-acetylmuramyl-L-alanine amidase AmpD [Burkholderiales bacterium]